MRRMLVVGVSAALTLAAACGDDDDSAAGVPTGDQAATTNAAAPTTGATTAPPTAAAPDSTLASTAAPASSVPADLPQRIVSLAPTHTETLFAIGAGEQVVAVEDQSNHPPEAEAVRTDLSGFEPNVEAIAGYEPDLVVLSGDGGLVQQLENLGIDTWLGEAPVTFDDAYTQIEQLGAVTGHVAEAADLVARMQADIERIVAETPVPETPLSIYHELDPTYFTVTSNTFIGQVYRLFDLRNIADEAETDAGPYPQLNAEFIISANPDLIFLADTKCCGESVETVGARPGWQSITAVANGDVVSMDDDIASRWGPRVVEYVQAVADALEHAVQPAG
jgi:iron complex transport system substrate-binding protein